MLCLSIAPEGFGTLTIGWSTFRIIRQFSICVISAYTAFNIGIGMRLVAGNMV